jgi:CxxC motif-containing protein (DUF1111 family)|tara:strand:+ start:3796 stop:5268 length:1473 start_codon:yes stop_codon:yes gene_type:complete
MRALFLIFLSAALLLGCNQPSSNINNVAPEFSVEETLPGGQTSVSYTPFPSLQLPANNISDELRKKFHAGKAFANQPWVKAPTVTSARDGLGPIYNARTCLTCHIKGGKGFIPDDNATALTSTLIRLSQPAIDYAGIIKTGVNAHPVYGDQMQGESISLAHQLRHSQKTGSLKHDVAPEAYIYVNWSQSIFTYPDGEQITLRKPSLNITNLGYGPLGENTLYSIRVAPAIHGIGLLELIAEQDLLLNADQDDSNDDGISGRANYVWDIEKQATVIGRFGLKSNKPTLKMTVAGAFANDIGISNSLFPQQPCTKEQASCLKIQNGNDENNVELSDELLLLVTNFNRSIAPARSRNSQDVQTQKGRELFYQTGCNQCHTPRFVTQKSLDMPHLSEQIIWPYTDLLLHDMGPELADGRTDFLASGNEWRTAPLWGVGLLAQVNGSKALLHDGRAQTIEEAILWHGGEASLVKSRFVQLAKEERETLIKFVNSL